MRRISCLAIVCLVFAVTACCGCSGQEGSPALAIAEPDNTPAPVRAAEISSELVQRDEQPAIAAEPDVTSGGGPAAIPETADAALRAILNGLHENRPEAVWDALPGSYQQDVNDLVHLFARRLHPEGWKWFVQIVRKGAVVLRLPLDDREETTGLETALAGGAEADEGIAADAAGSAIQQTSIRDRLANLKAENTRLGQLLARQKVQLERMQEMVAVERRRAAVARAFDNIADTGSTGLEILKTADIGSVLRCEEGRTILEAWQAAGTGLGTSDLQDFLELAADPSNVRLVLKESTDDRAVVEIIFPNDVPGEIECVRVDRKWIPRLLTEAWPDTIANLKRGVLEVLPSETATENFGPVFQYLSMIDLGLDGDLAQAQSEGDKGDTAADANRSALLDAPIMLLEYLIAGPHPAEPDDMLTDADGAPVDLPGRSAMGSPEEEARPAISPFEEMAGKSLLDEGKRVAVVCHSAAAVQTDHPTFAAGVIEEISRRFKGGKINVVEADKVVAWIKGRSNFMADSDLTPLGTELEADYIVHFQIEALGFAEENYPELRRGRAQGRVMVVEITTDEEGQKRARVIFKQPFQSKHPNSPLIAADPEEPEAFKQRYLARLHYELARLFLREP